MGAAVAAALRVRSPSDMSVTECLCVAPLSLSSPPLSYSFSDVSSPVTLRCLLCRLWRRRSSFSFSMSMQLSRHSFRPSVLLCPFPCRCANVLCGSPSVRVCRRRLSTPYVLRRFACPRPCSIVSVCVPCMRPVGWMDGWMRCVMRSLLSRGQSPRFKVFRSCQIRLSLRHVEKKRCCVRSSLC
jgi:hypothetical protein